MNISYTRSLFMIRTGVHSGLEKHRFHQAEEPHSPDLIKGDQTFVFVRASTEERSWLRFIKRAGSKPYTSSCKGYFFQMVILNVSPLLLRLCALGSGTALIYDELYI